MIHAVLTRFTALAMLTLAWSVFAQHQSKPSLGIGIPKPPLNSLAETRFIQDNYICGDAHAARVYYAQLQYQYQVLSSDTIPPYKELPPYTEVWGDVACRPLQIVVETQITADGDEGHTHAEITYTVSAFGELVYSRDPHRLDVHTLPAPPLAFHAKQKFLHSVNKFSAFQGICRQRGFFSGKCKYDRIECGDDVIVSGGFSFTWSHADQMFYTSPDVRIGPPCGIDTMFPIQITGHHPAVRAVMTPHRLKQLVHTGKLQATVQFQETDGFERRIVLRFLMLSVPEPQVASVAWQPLAAKLDANPNIGGGRRMFPGKQTASDNVDRRRVQVRATVDPPREGVFVYFRPFDIDDPSSDKAPLDRNGSAGNDNHGRPNTGALSTFVAITNKTGEASVKFSVTTQPGDNFRIAASTELELLDSYDTVGTDVKPSPAAVLHGGAVVKTTEMLTVWRKLHIEVDSMGPVVGNEVHGHIIGFEPPYSKHANRIFVDKYLGDRSPDLDSKPPQNGRFENGTLTVASNVRAFPVDGNGGTYLTNAVGIDITAGPLPFVATKGSASVWGQVADIIKMPGLRHEPTRWMVSVSLQGGPNKNLAEIAGGTLSIDGGSPMEVGNVFPNSQSIEVIGNLKIPFLLKDDDGGVFCGADVPEPDTSLLEVALRPGYVTPVYDIGDKNSNVPWVANLDYFDSKKVEQAFDFDAIASESDSMFWTIYILGAYQPSEEDDRDPDSETDFSIVGVAVPYRGVAIFMEMFNEFVPLPTESVAAVTAHEVAHLFGAEHEPDYDLMSDIPAFQSLRFSDVTLDRIRRVVAP